MRQILNTVSSFVFLVVLIGFTSCGNAETKIESKETAIDTATKNEEDIAELTAEQIKAVDIELSAIEQKNLTAVVKTNGQLTVPPQYKASVNALVGGVIRKITVLEGENVKKGQVVAYIENPDYIRLQNDYLTSKDNIVYLRQEFERQKTLSEADAGIGKVYQQASANYKAEQSRLLTLEQQLRQININPGQVSKGNVIRQIPILAPISGMVGHVILSIGTYTDVSSPIMEIVNNSKILCDLLVYEKDISKVKPGQKVEFILTSQGNLQVSGKVYGINKSFEKDQKAVVVHTVIDNVSSLNLIPGMYVSAIINVGEQLVPALPEDAVVKANDKEYIFILQKIEMYPPGKSEGGKTENTGDKARQVYQFKRMEIVTGVNEVGYVEIKLLGKLPPDAKIVTKGAFYIYSKMQNIESDEM